MLTILVHFREQRIQMMEQAGREAASLEKDKQELMLGGKLVLLHWRLHDWVSSHWTALQLQVLILRPSGIHCTPFFDECALLTKEGTCGSTGRRCKTERCTGEGETSPDARLHAGDCIYIIYIYSCSFGLVHAQQIEQCVYF